MNPEACPQHSACSKIKVARLTHARPCCRNGETLEAICARCEEERISGEKEFATAVKGMSTFDGGLGVSPSFLSPPRVGDLGG